MSNTEAAMQNAVQLIPATYCAEPLHVQEFPRARIRQRGRSVTQSGRAGESTWLLTFEPQFRKSIDFLTGTTVSRDTLQQVELQFVHLDDAVAFAERSGFAYDVEAPARRRIQVQSYADNFRHDRLVPWTH